MFFLSCDGYCLLAKTRGIEPRGERTVAPAGDVATSHFDAEIELAEDVGARSALRQDGK